MFMVHLQWGTQEVPTAWLHQQVDQLPGQSQLTSFLFDCNGIIMYVHLASCCNICVHGLLSVVGSERCIVTKPW